MARVSWFSYLTPYEWVIVAIDAVWWVSDGQLEDSSLTLEFMQPSIRLRSLPKGLSRFSLSFPDLHVLRGLMLGERSNFAHQNELQVASRWCFVTEKYGIKSHDACLDLCAAIRWAANRRVLVSVMPVCESDARGRTRCRSRISVLVLGVVIGLEGCGDAQRFIKYRH